MKLKVVLEAQEGGGYAVYVPPLPGCISKRDTIEETLKIELYLEPDDDLIKFQQKKIKI